MAFFFLQRALQNYYQHQHIETCTKFTKVLFCVLKRVLWFHDTKKNPRFDRIEK